MPLPVSFPHREDYSVVGETTSGIGASWIYSVRIAVSRLKASMQRKRGHMVLRYLKEREV